MRKSVIFIIDKIYDRTNCQGLYLKYLTLLYMRFATAYSLIIINVRVCEGHGIMVMSSKLEIKINK